MTEVARADGAVTGNRLVAPCSVSLPPRPPPFGSFLPFGSFAFGSFAFGSLLRGSLPLPCRPFACAPGARRRARWTLALRALLRLRLRTRLAPGRRRPLRRHGRPAAYLRRAAGARAAPRRRAVERRRSTLRPCRSRRAGRVRRGREARLLPCACRSSSRCFLLASGGSVALRPLGGAGADVADRSGESAGWRRRLPRALALRGRRGGGPGKRLQR